MHIDRNRQHGIGVTNFGAGGHLRTALPGASFGHTRLPRMRPSSNDGLLHFLPATAGTSTKNVSPGRKSADEATLTLDLGAGRFARNRGSRPRRRVAVEFWRGKGQRLNLIGRPR
jgi:hypothetical protein